MKTDLHIHSNASSDGQFSIQEIMRMAAEQDIDVMAITDHDTMDSVEEALLLGHRAGIQVIRGVEVFSQQEGKLLHILGYGLLPEYPAMRRLLDKVANNRKENISEQFRIIREHGYEIDEQAVFDYASSKALLPSAYAYGLLVNHKNADKPVLFGMKPIGKDIIALSKKLFSVGKPLYANEFIPKAKDVISTIHICGGVAILAHPGLDLKHDEVNILNKLIELGLDGVECFHPSHSHEQAMRYLRYCEEHKLLWTCGSDFHGSLKPNIKLAGVTSHNNEKLILALMNAIEEKNAAARNSGGQIAQK